MKTISLENQKCLHNPYCIWIERINIDNFPEEKFDLLKTLTTTHNVDSKGNDKVTIKLDIYADQSEDISKRQLCKMSIISNSLKLDQEEIYQIMRDLVN